MVALFVTSAEADGKTALCAGIGKKLAELGQKVGFIMPLRFSQNGAADRCRDVAFMKEIFGLAEPVEGLCSVCLSRQELEKGLTEDVLNKIKQSYSNASKGKDVVLVEGLGGLGKEDLFSRACYQTADALDAKAIVVVRYSPDLSPAGVVHYSQGFGVRLLGVVVNFVPESRMETVRRDLVPSLARAGVKVLGILPEVRSLFGISVAELAEALGGEVVTSSDRTGGIVENIMLGAMTPDSGIDYFSRKANKAAVISGRRPDMQLAALETSTSCLVITDNSKPEPAVVSLAETRKVPTIVVKQNITGAIASIEQALARARFSSHRKLGALEDILEKNLDLKALYSGLGLKV